MDAEFIRTLRGEIRGGWEPGAGAICSQTVSGAFGRPGLSRSRPTPVPPASGSVRTPIRPPPRAAGAATRPTSGCCRGRYPVSARPRLRRRDAVPVPLRVPGVQPLALRLPEGTVRPGRDSRRVRKSPAGRRGGVGTTRGVARRPGGAPRAPGRGGRRRGAGRPGAAVASGAVLWSLAAGSSSRGRRRRGPCRTPPCVRAGGGAAQSRARRDTRLLELGDAGREAPRKPPSGSQGLFSNLLKGGGLSLTWGKVEIVWQARRPARVVAVAFAFGGGPRFTCHQSRGQL